MAMSRSQPPCKPVSTLDKKKSADSVVAELKAKMRCIEIRLLDCQNQNQMLRKEMHMAKKVVANELLGGADVDFKKLLHQAGKSKYQGNREKVQVLKEKLSHLEKRIKEVLDSEIQYLLEKSQQMTHKAECWKKKCLELEKEEECLQLELERLQGKTKEDEQIQMSYRALDKELRARQTEKLDMRSKLCAERSRNELLAKQLEAVKEDLSETANKSGDERTLVEALKSQNEYLHDLLERQTLISEQENWRYKEDLREIQMKHACNKTTLEHLQDIIEQHNLDCENLREMASKGSSSYDEGGESPVPVPTESKSPPAENDVPNDENDVPDNSEQGLEEIASLREQCQAYQDLFWSTKGQKEQLVRTVLSNNEKIKGWIAQLLQTRSLYSQKCAENRDLLDTCKRLENAGKKTFPPNEGTNQTFTDELIRKGDVLMEEHQFLLSLWDTATNDTGNSLNVLLTSLKCTAKIFESRVATIEPPAALPSPEPEPAPPLQEVSA